MAVETASPAHAKALAAIHGEAFPPGETWGPDAIGIQLALPGVFGLFDACGGMLLGRVTAGEAEILTLAVLPALRRQGIGSALLDASVAEARRRGATTLFLEVATTNSAALGLYRRQGFIEVGRRRRYYANGSDALVLRLSLL